MSADEAPSGTGGGAAVPPAWATLRRHAAELVIVFVGVYAAFLLNRFDTDRHDAERRTQIVGALEREVSGNVDELRGDITGAATELSDFNRQLAAGAMPNLGITYTNSSYSPSDDAALMQAGGLELLDIETIELTRKVNALERELVAATHNQFEVCLTELANHRNEDFYDPATRQLKPQYKWYPVVLRNVIRNARDLLAAQEVLLAHLRSMQSADVSGQP